MPTSTSSTTHHCPSCNGTFQGKFCNNCGEKVFHPSDLGLRKFSSQTVDVFTHFDSKFLKSLVLLFKAPGFLPSAYVKGIRVRFAKPMQVFLLANIFFYFITHLIGVSDFSPHFGDHNYFSLSGYTLFNWAASFDQWIIEGINQLGESKMARLGLNEQQFAQNFFENSWIYSKTFIVLLIPLFAAVLWTVYSERFKYFGAALIFAVYFVSYQLLTFSVYSVFIYKIHIDPLAPIEWLLFKTPLKFASEFLMAPGFEFSNIFFWFPYLYIGIQRFGKGNPWVTLVSSFLCSKIFFFISFSVYKKLLIVITVLLMHKVV